MPIVEMKSPAKADAKPFTILPDEKVATTVSAKTASAKYSAAPNCMAACASKGAQVIRAKPLIMPPIKEPHVAISSAFRDCPFAVSLGPSKTVAAAATVPGVPTKMAEIQPP